MLLVAVALCQFYTQVIGQSGSKLLFHYLIFSLTSCDSFVGQHSYSEGHINFATVTVILFSVEVAFSFVFPLFSLAVTHVCTVI